jgi:NAD dependent epimerase/dehydratase family enzyme
MEKLEIAQLSKADRGGDDFLAAVCREWEGCCGS